MDSTKPLSIGITCYPTYGGSGVIATELGLSMARRGHSVHFISYDVPRRLKSFSDNVFFHEVHITDNPVFLHPPYALALTSKIVQVCTDYKLDLLHVHYAVPHATSAYLAKQILGSNAPKILTTLHGTDITLVGGDASYLPITRFSILQSDAVSAPSHFLKLATYRELSIPEDFPIDVISNFVDTEAFKPAACRALVPFRSLKGCCSRDRVLVHVSNFRPVKQIDMVIKVFAKVLESVPCYLVLAGDGPERQKAEKQVRSLGLQERVCFLGKQDSIPEVLQRSDIFLLPSKNESFGLAALEAMSCGLPVIASRVEGIPEVVIDGETGYLSDVSDVQGMAEKAVKLLKDNDLYRQISTNARRVVVEKYSLERLTLEFEELYRRILH